jgi:hypothetical protein
LTTVILPVRWDPIHKLHNIHTRPSSHTPTAAVRRFDVSPPRCCTTGSWGTSSSDLPLVLFIAVAALHWSSAEDSESPADKLWAPCWATRRLHTTIAWRGCDVNTGIRKAHCATAHCSRARDQRRTQRTHHTFRVHDGSNRQRRFRVGGRSGLKKCCSFVPFVRLVRPWSRPPTGVEQSTQATGLPTGQAAQLGLWDLLLWAQSHRASPSNPSQSSPVQHTCQCRISRVLYGG